MKQVTITTRAVYHKTASVTIDVPSNVGLHDIQVWLWENQDSYQEEMDSELEQTPLSPGLGMGDGMDDPTAESEQRFDFFEDGEKTYGGHV
jgi:hypothetical protein